MPVYSIFSLVASVGDAKSMVTIPSGTTHSQLSEEEALKAMEICPVGAILKKERGFATPIGERKFDKVPIGSEIENTVEQD